MVPAAIRDILYGLGRPGQLLLHALYSPPDVAMRKAVRFVARETKNRFRPLRERGRCSYPARGELAGEMSPRLLTVNRAVVEPIVPALNALLPFYLSHYVDLLGSG